MGLVANLTGLVATLTGQKATLVAAMMFLLLLDCTMIAEAAAGSDSVTVSSVWLNPYFYNKIRGLEPESKESRVNPRPHEAESEPIKARQLYF